MKLVVGLGNPGEKYRESRHNLGFMVVDGFAISRGLSWRFSQDWPGYWVKSNDFILLKPSTFMNRSGEAVAKVMDYFRMQSDDVLVVYDDVDLAFSKIRLAFNGLSAGHHGIDSIIENLGMEFGRLRVGIGHPREISKDKVKQVADYVLNDFNQDEKQQLFDVIKKSMEALN